MSERDVLLRLGEELAEAARYSLDLPEPPGERLHVALEAWDELMIDRYREAIDA